MQGECRQRGEREPRAGQKQGETREIGLRRGSRGRKSYGSKNGLRFLLLQFGFIFVSIYISFFFVCSYVKYFFNVCVCTGKRIKIKALYI